MFFKFLFGSSQKAEEERKRKENDDFWYLAKHPTMNEHYKLLEKIKEEYPKAKDTGNYFGKEMKRVMRLCTQDIGIAEECRDLWRKYDHYLDDLPDYPSFARLAIIYEKREEYAKAIDVCTEAIRLGYESDGTKNGLKGRIARLLRKEEAARKKDLPKRGKAK